MRVAVCLSGHFRTFKQVKESLYVNIIEPYSPDIFIHTWDGLGYSRNGKYHNINERTQEIIDKNKNFGCSLVEFMRDCGKITEDLYNDLNVKDIVVENYEDVEPLILEKASKVKNKYDIDHPPNFISSQRKTYLCNKLKNDYESKNNFVYDIVIKCRPDLYYNSINLDLNTTVLNTPISQSYGTISDIFAYSNSKIMNQYCSLFEKMDDYIEENIHFNPHLLLLHHIETIGIPYVKDHNLDLDILKI
jgi:hypothetical protein